MSFRTHYRASYFHTPDAFAQSAFLHVLRAGHLQAAPDYVVDRHVCTGHDLIFCVSGAGYVQIQGVEHRVGKSQLLWIDGRIPHKHWPESSEPWELLWVRADGGALTLSAEELNVKHRPVFAVDKDVAILFQQVMKHLKTEPTAMDALLHAEISALLAAVFSSRAERGYTSEGKSVHPALKLALAKMGAYPHQRWTVRKLAETAGMSEQKFFRAFHEATGSSPIAWLRRVRMNSAKRKLVETTDTVKEIAEQVGYSNPFYFSRDFKAACGLSPKHYREQEKLLHIRAHDVSRM